MSNIKKVIGITAAIVGAVAVTATVVKKSKSKETRDLLSYSNQKDIGQIGFSEPVELDFTKKKRILITGANSYIGESFENYAKEKYGENFEIDTIDMIDRTWRKADFSSYDAVFHVAGIAHADVGNVSDEVKQKYYAVNTDLAIETANKAKSEGVKQFVFMSSMIIYGESAGTGKLKRITKYTSPAPANFYGDSKWQADMGVRKLADENYNVAVLRPPMIYGKGSKGNYPMLAKLAKKLPVFPNVDNERSMLHIDNLCEFLCQLMIIGKGGVFFPQNAEYTKTCDMVKMIADVSNKNIRCTSVLAPAVFIGSKLPGKIGDLVNKAFGNFVYEQEMSEYSGLHYQGVGLKESIMKTENDLNVRKKYNVDATAIIMTKNEEKNIGDCLDSMKGFAKRCVVIDCGSTDKTVEIAKSKGADVYFHEFEYYAKQFNWGIDFCDIETEWIIRLDADERFPDKLKYEIASIINDSKNSNVNGITIEADYFFLGKCMKHGLTNKRKMMMFKKSCGCIEDKRRDAHSIISSGINVDVKNKFIHYDFKNLDAYIKRYNWYATREMQDYIEYINEDKGATYDGDREIQNIRAKKYGIYYKAPKFLRAQLWFVYNYIVKRGFLDGKEGFLFLFFECYWYRMLVDAKIYEQLKTGNDFEELRALD